MTQRRVPDQERAQQTVEALLQAAASLLDQVGLEGFNTNLLAKRAKVRVRTVYRYFPNKHAVITLLAQRAIEQWGTWFGEVELLADPRVRLEAVWPRLIDAYVRGIRALPAGLALRRAMRADDQLRVLDDRDNAVLAARVAQVLKLRWPGASASALRSATRVLLESASAIIDVSLGHPGPAAKALVRSLKAMHSAYLNQLELTGSSRASRTSAA